MPNKHKPYSSKSESNLFTGITSAEGILENQLANSRLNSTFGHRSSRELGYGKNHNISIDVYVEVNGKIVKRRKILSDVVITMRDLKTDKTKVVMNRDHQVLWTTADSRENTAIEVINDTKRIERRTAA
jgi:hypothetical protein